MLHTHTYTSARVRAQSPGPADEQIVTGKQAARAKIHTHSQTTTAANPHSQSSHNHNQPHYIHICNQTPTTTNPYPKPNPADEQLDTRKQAASAKIRTHSQTTNAANSHSQSSHNDNQPHYIAPARLSLGNGHAEFLCIGPCWTPQLSIYAHIQLQVGLTSLPRATYAHIHKRACACTAAWTLRRTNQHSQASRRRQYPHSQPDHNRSISTLTIKSQRQSTALYRHQTIVFRQWPC